MSLFLFSFSSSYSQSLIDILLSSGILFFSSLLFCELFLVHVFEAFFRSFSNFLKKFCRSHLTGAWLQRKKTEKKVVFYTFLRGYGYQSHFMESSSSDIHAEEMRLINFIANPNLSMTMYNDTLSDIILKYLWVDCLFSSCFFGFIRVWVGRGDWE